MDTLVRGMEQLVSGKGEVYGFAANVTPIMEACERLNLPFRDGRQVYYEWREGPGRQWKWPRRPPISDPEAPHAWLGQFHGVATRYLDHYMAWYRVHLDQKHAC